MRVNAGKFEQSKAVYESPFRLEFVDEQVKF